MILEKVPAEEQQQQLPAPSSSPSNATTTPLSSPPRTPHNTRSTPNHSSLYPITTMPNIVVPPLPKIEGDQDIVRVLYAHHSLRRPGAHMLDDYGDADRLAHIGSHAWDLALVSHFFHKRPLTSSATIAEQIDEAVSDEALRGWSDAYHLNGKVYTSYDHSDAMSCPEDIRTFFHVYAGALYIRNGMAAVQRWVTELVEPSLMDIESPFTPINTPSTSTSLNTTSPNTSTAASSSNHTSPNINSNSYYTTGGGPPSYNDYQTSPPRGAVPSQTSRDLYGSGLSSSSGSAGLPPPPPPPDFGTLTHVTVALLNQTASQRHVTVAWDASSEGPSHAPRWTVRCLLNGVERGIGVAPSQKLAKDIAAKQAWGMMNW